MKNNIKKIALPFFLLMGLVILNSCKKEFLEIVPKGKVIASTTADYENLLNNIEDLVRMTFNVSINMGDEVASVNPFWTNSDLAFQRTFKWEPLIYDVQQTSPEIQNYMKAVYTYNTIINETMASSNGTEQKKKEIIAEAKAGRAFYYFYLINLFAKQYNSSSAGTDLGFPIVTTPDVNKTDFSDRSTVKGVYDFIIKDLTDAIADLPGIFHRIRMSRPAAQAFLGKVYMNMGKYDDALPLLNAGLTTLTSSSFGINFYNYNTEFNNGGVFYPVDPLIGPAIITIDRWKEAAYGKTIINGYALFGSDLVVSPSTLALYGVDDQRLKQYFVPTFPFETETFPGGLRRRWAPLAIIGGVSIPDMYLLRAEAKARTDDLPGAVQDVETLRKNRMPVGSASVPTAAAASRVPLLKFIFEERVREFAATGDRWFDMRRLNNDPELSSTIGKTHVVYAATADASGNPVAVETFTLDPARLTLKIPARYLNTNPGMQDNP